MKLQTKSLISLAKLGNDVTHVPGIHALVKRLAAGDSETWSLAFNMTEGLPLPTRQKSPSKYPLFANPLAEGSSKGMKASNKIRNASQLYPATQAVRASAVSSTGILIEAFLSGREFTVFSFFH
ncbi:unnamed protein product [Aspergillus oryzae]|nr:unnamed protein product [Aspergillus oryzae]GMF92385.1 unnamed protein product [Aspergillus oryzae]